MSTAFKLYKTGQVCTLSGIYGFVRYTDGSTWPPPTPQEREIPLSAGEVFPPIRSTGKGAIWQYRRAA